MKQELIRPQMNTAGLVARYKLWDGFEVSGKVFDYSLKGNRGTVINALPAYPGFAFAGADLIDIDTALSDIQTATGTMSAWVRVSDASFNTVINLADTDGNERFYLWIQSAFCYGQLRVAGVTQWQFNSPGGVSFDNNLWKHIVLVQNGTEPALYVNGVGVTLSFTTSTDKTKWVSHLTNADNVRIGCCNSNSAGNHNFMLGKLDDVMFFNTIKTAREARDIFELTRWRYGV